MKKLLGIVVLGYRILQDNWKHTGNEGDKTRKGRNSYAHVAICIKSKFKASYKDIDDDKFDEVINYIEFLKKNPS